MSADVCRCLQMSAGGCLGDRHANAWIALSELKPSMSWVATSAWAPMEHPLVPANRVSLGVGPSAPQPLAPPLEVPRSCVPGDVRSE